MKNEVLNILSKIELNIDYPEYDEPELTIKEIKDKLANGEIDIIM